MNIMNIIPTCTEQEHIEALQYTAKYAPDYPPMGWQELPDFPDYHPLSGTKCYRRIGDKLAVLLTASRWPNDTISERVWLHVSLSRPNRMPSYEDLCDVKALFIGKGRKALQIFPAEDQHVNIHSYCLHLWCAVEGDTDLPEFGAWGTI